MKDSDSLFDFKFFKVINKKKFGWFVSVEPAVVIIPVIRENELFKLGLIRCTRPAIEKTSWEFPGGGIEEGEIPEEAAIRELKEETGFSSDVAVNIGSFYESPGKMDFLHHIICVLEPVEAGHGFSYPESEKISDFKFFEWEEIEKKIMSGKIVSGPTISALQMFVIFLKNNPKGLTVDSKKR
ncbi:hypothetical protein LPTSP3_g21120 [Leptospira kobayashii]|uniref:Nudix hydrolase domain-containing protein n=1 Tax=Leptospira kobayashii TaxID=1917830 RepID=A0ABM7UKA7_9LEPT|nr:NUDIX hydrolase [Leptospira kobayashii]BDA79182.1 hypothetical protein LPTSP3_g21120 [Leptospira kobayashii]